MPKNFSLSKALLISVCIHWLFFSTFIFVFPVSHLSFKPEFLFLGSILQHQDLTTLSHDTKSLNLNSQSNYIFATQNQPRESPRGLEGRMFLGPAKPYYQGASDSKLFITKSMFYDSAADSKKHTIEIEELNFNLKLQPYTPLKYNPDDKN